MIFPIKAVIFDADGVLLDSLSVWKELGKRYITDLGYQPVAGMDEILFPMSMEQGAAWLKSRFTLEYSEEKIVMDLKSRIRKYYFEEVPAKSGARELLQCLAEQKIPAAVATSSPREHICRALERNGLLSFFDKIYTTSEIGESKHSPRVYLTAAEALGTELSRTLVVEDSLYALQTAGNAGFLTAGIYDALGEPDQEQLKKQNYPKAERLFVSPLLRCRQTAACIYPGQEQQVIQNLRECDFGRFENKNWKEMTGDAEYQAWVDSNATLPFPGGEDPQEFRDRACQGFLEGLKLCAEDGTESAAFVVHGGIIMAVLERFADRKKAFYEWHVGNGEGYEAEADPAAWSDASGQQPVLRVVNPIQMTKQQ